jgi:CBS domain-containing protein
MARTATGYPVALGFRGQLATGQAGDPPGKLDLKRGAIIPLVNLVRFHALAGGATNSNTLDRIAAAASLGVLDRALADGLREAFEVINGIRFERHAAQVQAGETPDNFLDPEELAPIARADLREALHVVRRAQKRVGAWSPP